MQLRLTPIGETWVDLANRTCESDDGDTHVTLWWDRSSGATKVTIESRLRGEIMSVPRDRALHFYTHALAQSSIFT